MHMLLRDLSPKPLVDQTRLDGSSVPFGADDIEEQTERSASSVPKHVGVDQKARDPARVTTP